MIAIRQIILVLVMGGLFGAPPIFAQTPSDLSGWVGVWRVSSPDAPESTGYWLVSKDESKLVVQECDLGWAPSPITTTKADDTALSLEQYLRGYKLVLSVTRQGDRFSGTSKIVHVQYTQAKPIDGVRLLKANHWEPLEGIRKIQDAAGLADVASALRKAALQMNVQKFLAGWDSEIGGPYLPFLEPFWDPDPAVKAEKVRRLYQMLRSKQFAESLKTAVLYRGQVVQLVKDKQNAFYFNNPTVVVPSLASAQVTSVDLMKGKVHIKMQVPESLTAASRSRLKWQMAREQIKLGFLMRFPLKLQSSSIRIIQDGISGYLGAQLLGMSLPDLLGTTQPKLQDSLARLDDFRKRMGESGNTEVDEIRFTRPADSLDNQQIVDLIGYKFGEQVGKRFSTAELAKLERVRLLELADNYLRP